MEQEESKPRLSKRAMKKLEKVQQDEEIDDLTKKELIETITHKRQKTDPDKNFYVEGERKQQSGDRPGQSSLWDDHEKAFLEDVTMNLIDDDEVMNNTKGKTVMKWDKFKKKYTLQKVDREGRVMSERRNESGAKIKKDEKQVDIYKRW